MHQVLVGNIAVGKHDRINLVFGNQLFHILFLEDRDAFRIQASCRFGRITAAGNVRNLGGGECDYVLVGIVAEQDIEVVEVPACGAKNQNSLHGHTSREDRFLLHILSHVDGGGCTANHSYG